ncbi:radical SAM family protein [Streptococcus pneumoniae]|nr:radical SAM family protein [Streptococcus pneumoniae]
MKVIKSYDTLNDYYRKLFGEKTFKVPIDAGFDCPNRDGTVAHGGCTFCTVSGSGDAIVAPDPPIRNSLEKRLLKSLLMRDLTVPIVMELWLMEAVLFVRFPVLEMPL